MKQRGPHYILQPDAASVGRFFSLGLQILENTEDAGIRQETIKLLATEEGLRYIRDVADRFVPEAMARGILEKAALWKSQVSPLFLFVTHSSATSSAFLEEQVASIYNFLVGVGGSRMDALFNYVIALAKDPSRPSPPSNLALAESSLAVLAQMIGCNTTNMTNDAFRRYVDELTTLATTRNPSIDDEPVQLRANAYASFIRRRLQVGDNIPDLQPSGAAVSSGPAPSFRLRSDFPGHLSADGRRHGNDHADIAKISIMPNYEEIMSDRSEYLPVTDPEQWHRQGISGRLDREFRLLREDTVGQLRDVVRTELDSLSRLEEAAANKTKQRVQAAPGKDSIRYCTYQAADIIRVEFERRTGLEFLVRFQQPAAKPNPGDSSDGKAAKLHKHRLDWWTRMKKRLQPGGLLSAIDVRGSVLFFIVAKTTLRSRLDAPHPREDLKDLKEESKDKPEEPVLTLADDANFSYVRLNLVSADKVEHVNEALEWFLQSKRHNDDSGISQQRQRVLVEFPGILLDAFEHTLKALQTASKRMDVPFSDLIAPAKTDAGDPVSGYGMAEIPPPAYARKHGFVFNLESVRNGSSDEILQHSIRRPLATDKLEKGSTLDGTQSRALTQTLSRSVALIQGPPGTGKTYVGVEIIKVLLGNKKQAKLGPMLCVCYTNHALDQLLEHLLDYNGTGQIIRMGSGSKSERLKELNLRDVGGKVVRTREEKTSMWSRGTELEVSTKQLQAMAQRLNRSLSWSELVGFLWETHREHYRQLFNTEVLLSGHGTGAGGAKDKDGWETVRGKPDKTIRDWLGGGNPEDVLHYGRGSAGVGRRRRPEELGTTDLFTLTRRERRELHQWWQTECFRQTKDEVASEHQLYVAAKRSFDLAVREVDLRCLNEADIIGVTTTGLARNLEMLRHLPSKVLFCEEAGEVLEAHLLTSLLPSVEHAILIGDHQQLRPQVQNYELRSDNPRGRQFSFDMSLFERLVVPPHASQPRLAFSQLATQRRMHPSISALIRIPSYPELQDGGSVADYPEVPGLVRRLFWLQHSQPERGAAEGQQADPTSASRTNSFEVEMVAALVSHLAKQGVYASGDIAVLTPYLGQMQLLQRRMASMFEISFNDRDLEDLEAAEPIDGEEPEAAPPSPRRGPQPAKTTLLRSVRVATVDNFQGEEAKVVIVSLVRSNPQQRCGFLSTANRINVLLSRAKHGMIIVGNSDTCAGVSMWRHVVAMLAVGGNIGEALPLRCPRHPGREFAASDPSHFSQFAPDGGCLLSCDKRLSCGHACTGRCHSSIVHLAVECLEPCPRPLRGCDHSCPRPCGRECIAQCNVVLSGTILKLPCGHQQISPRCFEAQKPAAVRCVERVTRIVPGCGDKVVVACHVDVARTSFVCTAKCGSPLPCGHSCGLACHVCRTRENGEVVQVNHGMCTQPCQRPYSACQHVCRQACHGAQPCGPCIAPCEVRCSHSKCDLRCHEPCVPCAEEACSSSCPHSSCTMP